MLTQELVNQQESVLQINQLRADTCIDMKSSCKALREFFNFWDGNCEYPQCLDKDGQCTRDNCV